MCSSRRCTSAITPVFRAGARRDRWPRHCRRCCCPQRRRSNFASAHPLHLAMMLSSEPGEALGQLTATGLPRIIRMATVALSPQLDPLIGRESAHRLIDLVARLTVSYFLSPDESVDLSDADIARQFLRPIITAVALPESFSGTAATLNRSTS